MTHFLRYFRENSQPASFKRARGVAITVNPHAAATPRPGAPLPLSQAQRDARNREIRTLAAQGVKHSEIAERYSLHPTTIGRLVRVPRV